MIKEVSFYDEDDYNYTSDRYRLTGVAITDKVTNSKQTYSFDYYSGNTYSPYSTKAVDYWGFYNGKESNTDLVPRQEISMEVRYIGNRSLYAFIGGADRTPNIDYAKTYTLRGITYPTGAREQFEYGLNKYKSNGVVKEAGGLRIQRISTYDHLNNQTEIRTFQYGLNGDESGRICLEPNLQYFCSEHQRMYVTSSETATRRYRIYSSQSTANLFYSSGSPYCM